MKKQKILIVGGGFAGVKAALELSGDDHFAVTLIADADMFRYYPALYHTATGGAREVSEIPLKELLAKHPVRFEHARALHLDRNKKRLTTKGAGTIDYDVLILALGMTTNYFGIAGLEKFSYGIKSLDEVERLKRHLHEQLHKNHSPDAHYLVVGGGPTGVELAGMLPSYLKRIAAQHGITHRAIHVELIEAMPRILPRMPKDVARATNRRLRKLGVAIHTNQAVQAETKDSLLINGVAVPSKTVIWTAGVACNPFFMENNFVLTERHKAQVNTYLAAEDNIYVLGDNADTVYSGVAQTALHDAVFVANNLKRLARHKSAKPYKPKRPIYVTPTGPRWASVVWGRLRLYGRLGWTLRWLSDLVAYHDYEPWWPAAQHWRAMNDQQESCPVCGQQPLQ